MSLDVCLIDPRGRQQPRDRIYVRQEGAMVEVAREQWEADHPGVEPVVVADDGAIVFRANITHNLAGMAAEVRLDGHTYSYDDLYEVLWRPDEHGLTHARDLVDALRDGLASLTAAPDYFQQWNPENGWGDYTLLVRFTAGYLAACEQWPDAEVRVSR